MAADAISSPYPPEITHGRARARQADLVIYDGNSAWIPGAAGRWDPSVVHTPGVAYSGTIERLWLSSQREHVVLAYAAAPQGWIAQRTCQPR